jgi:hypothetical protein
MTNPAGLCEIFLSAEQKHQAGGCCFIAEIVRNIKASTLTEKKT